VRIQKPRTRSSTGGEDTETTYSVIYLEVRIQKLRSRSSTVPEEQRSELNRGFTKTSSCGSWRKQVIYRESLRQELVFIKARNREVKHLREPINEETGTNDFIYLRLGDRNKRADFLGGKEQKKVQVK
jgi:hypothetical protein